MSTKALADLIVVAFVEELRLLASTTVYNMLGTSLVQRQAASIRIVLLKGIFLQQSS